MSIELQYLIFAVVLVLIQLVLQATAGFLTVGFGGLVGSRDDDILTEGILGRFERSYYNMLETFPVFAALVLAVQVTESWSTTTALAVQIYFWARVVYVPVYVAGIPVLRTLIWIAAMVGILMLAWQLLQQIV